MTDEQIIKQIKLHPVLYNSELPQYRDHDARAVAWIEIARKFDLDVEDVKAKWAKLRNCYSNALKRRYKKNYVIPWKFQKQMEFLLPHVKYKSKTKINESLNTRVKEESQSSFNNDFESQNGQYSPASSPKYVSPIEDDISTDTPMDSQSRMENSFLKDFVTRMDASNLRSVDMDETDHFFLSMSKVLKKLPEEDQADIKFELHKLIYEAEKRHLKNNSHNELY